MRFLLTAILLALLAFGAHPALAQETAATEAPAENSQAASGAIQESAKATEVNPSEYLGIVSTFTDMFISYSVAFAAFILFVIAGFTYFIGRSRKEIESSLQESAQQFRNDTSRLIELERSNTVRELQEFKDSLPLLVEKSARSGDGELKPEIARMRESYKEYSAELKIYRDLLKAKEAAVKGAYESDPDMNKAYADYVSQLPNDPNNPEYLAKRNQARERLTGTLKAAENGDVDVNLLFNSAMVASRLNMDDIALKLMTYAEYFSPCASHRIALYRLQMTLGREYATTQQKIVGATSDVSYKYSLEVVEKTPKEIESEAFTSALKAAANAPLPQNEIIYAELWNMAQKTRESGGYERMRDVLLACFAARSGNEVTAQSFKHEADKKTMLADTNLWTQQKDVKIPSNLLGKISATYALIGTPGWEEGYEKFITAAVNQAKQESPITTWRKAFIRDSLSTAKMLGIHGQIESLLKSSGLIDEKMSEEMAILENLRSGNLAKLMQAIADN